MTSFFFSRICDGFQKRARVMEMCEGEKRVGEMSKAAAARAACVDLTNAAMAAGPLSRPRMKGLWTSPPLSLSVSSAALTLPPLTPLNVDLLPMS